MFCIIKDCKDVYTVLRGVFREGKVPVARKLSLRGQPHDTCTC